MSAVRLSGVVVRGEGPLRTRCTYLRGRPARAETRAAGIASSKSIIIFKKPAIIIPLAYIHTVLYITSLGVTCYNFHSIYMNYL